MPKAKINGININYKVQGKEKGEPLVLISGGVVDQWLWIFQTRAFKKDYRVITFDNRGFGKSDKPGGSGVYTMEIMAKDVVDLMDLLEIPKAHILGLSLGGMIAQVLAIKYPDRVNKLILGCTFAARDKSIGSGIAREFSEAMGYPNEDWTDDDARREPMLKIVVTLASCAFDTPPFRIAFRIFGPLIKLGVKLYYKFIMETTGLPGQEEALLAHNTLNDLSRIQAHTLVIRGTKDRIIKPSSSEVMAGLIPNVKLVKIEGGHAFFIENSGKCNDAVLAFLR